MSVAAVQVPKRPVSYADFLAGGTVDFGSEWASLTFTFRDDVWYALDAVSPGRPAKDGTYNFQRLSHAKWLIPDARDCIASAWLEHSLAAGTIQNYLKALVLLGRAFPNHKGDLLSLTRRDGTLFRQFLQKERKAETVGATAVVNYVQNLNGIIGILRLLPKHEGRVCEFAPKAPKAAIAENGKRKENFRTPTEKVIPDEVIRDLVRACRADEAEYEAVLRGEATARMLFLGAEGAARPVGKGGGSSEERCLTYLRDRAIRAQMLKFAICFGRRVSAFCALPIRPKMRLRETERYRVLRLHIHESKITKSNEIARAVDAMVDLAIDALDRTTRYTKLYRASAGGLADHLFLTSAGCNGKGVKVISGDDVNRYLRGSKNHRGLIERRGISDNGHAAHITSHNFRTTRLTRIGERAGPSVASQDAGHLSEAMTNQFYIAGTGPMKESAEKALRCGAVAGEAAEMLAGERAIGERINRRMIVRLMRKEDAMVVNITRYGVCFLQAETGPCPTGNPCWLGIDPDAEQISQGRGCEWQGLTPHAVPALEHDERMLSEEIDLYAGDPRFAHFVSNLVERREIVRTQLAIARGLQQQVDETEVEHAST